MSGGVTVPQVGKSLGIQVNDYISEGGFARVFRAEHLNTGIELAIKRLVSTDQRSPEILERESHIQRSLDHPFIVHCYGLITENGESSVVCDYVPGKSLLTLVNDKQGLPEAQVRKFTVQLLSALRYLHDEKSIAHRDIKLDNVVVEKEMVRLIDFGYSRSLDPTMATRCGSLPYAAPEILRGRRYTQAVDIWSLGVVVYAMLACDLPFRSQETQKLMDQICFENFAPFGRKVSSEATDFVTRMLQKDPRKRLTVSQACEHAFIRRAENHWLLKEAVLDRPEFRFVAPDGLLDTTIVERLVLRGYDRDSIRLNSGDEIKDEASLAYELLKVLAIRQNLTQLVMDRAAAQRFRSMSMGCMAEKEAEAEEGGAQAARLEPGRRVSVSRQRGRDGEAGWDQSGVMDERRIRRSRTPR